MRGEACKTGVSYIVCTCPVGDSIEIYLQDGGEIFLSVTEDDRLGDIGACAQRILDQRRRNRLSARGDNEIPGPIDQPQAFASPFTDVACAQPTVSTLDLAGSLVSAPIAVEQIRSAHQDFSVVRQAHFKPLDRRAHIARARKAT